MSAGRSGGGLGARVLGWLFLFLLGTYVVKFPESAADTFVAIIEGFGAFVGHFAENQAAGR